MFSRQIQRDMSNHDGKLFIGSFTNSFPFQFNIFLLLLFQDTQRNGIENLICLENHAGCLKSSVAAQGYHIYPLFTFQNMVAHQQ